MRPVLLLFLYLLAGTAIVLAVSLTNDIRSFQAVGLIWVIGAFPVSAWAWRRSGK